MSHAFQSDLRRWDVVAGLIQSCEGRDVVEVGCKEGRTTSVLLKNLPDIRIVAIDPWASLPNEAEDYEDHDFAKIEAEFWERVGEHRDRVVMLRMISMEAVKQVSAADVVFIDAAHDFDNALADIRAWWPLVRAGGFLCGHDYQQKFPGVMRAVAKCFPLMKVAVCPDSVWVVQKDPALQVAA